MDMQSCGDAVWRSVYETVLACGGVRDLSAFHVEALQGARRMAPYDCARVDLFDRDGNKTDHYLDGDDERWVIQYYERFNRLENGAYMIVSLGDKMDTRRTETVIKMYDWKLIPRDDFIDEYITPRGFRYSIAFQLFDALGAMRATYMMSRTTPVAYTADEIRSLCLTIPQLNNLYKNLSWNPGYSQYPSSDDYIRLGLTQREAQIARLLFQGLSPKAAADRLHIALTTTYKHIAHIYEKLHVTSQREFLVYMMGNA